MGWAGAGLGWAGLSWAGLGWAGLDWAGLGWTRLGWTRLGWTGDQVGLGQMSCVGFICCSSMLRMKTEPVCSQAAAFRGVAYAFEPGCPQTGILIKNQEILTLAHGHSPGRSAMKKAGAPAATALAGLQ